MSADQIEELFGYIQERCLWQFFSRSWDRQENIDGVLDAAAVLLADGTPARETPMQKLFYADAAILVRHLRERFPWLAGLSGEETKALVAGLKDKLVNYTITRSLNGELNHQFY